MGRSLFGIQEGRPAVAHYDPYSHGFFLKELYEPSAGGHITSVTAQNTSDERAVRQAIGAAVRSVILWRVCTRIKATSAGRSDPVRLRGAVRLR